MDIKFEHNLCIIKINKCLVAKNLLMNVTKTNEHSNVTAFVHALSLTMIKLRGDAKTRNGTEPTRNIPQDAKTRNGHF